TAVDITLSFFEGPTSTNACGQFGLPAAVGVPIAAGNCITPATAVDRSAAQSSPDPCVVGRFNATQAASGAGSVQVFDRGGAALGWCTPVPYVLTAAACPAPLVGNCQQLATNVPVQPGYFRTGVIASDEAGNRTTAFSATVLEDINAPTVSALDPPGAITGNTTVNFPASASETAGNGDGNIENPYAALQ